MEKNKQIIKLYTELAENPKKDFGWEKGLENAKAHKYKQEWIEKIPSHIWEFCAAVGNPFIDADIKKGDTVLDLGCGAGVDVLVASGLVGDTGKVFGVDFTPKMVECATSHAKLTGAKNITILENSFDTINLEDESVDVVISNGAINLTSCKESVFAEIHRVLKPNCKIFFADIIDISTGKDSCFSAEQSSCCSNQEENWANCVAGTMRENELIALIEKMGFQDVICTGHTHYRTSDTTEGATFKATKIPTDRLRKAHWESIFKRVDYTQVLWHQSSPQKSYEFIQKYANKDSKIIDVGCGTSFLVDELQKECFNNITLLDTSKTSLDIIKERLSSRDIKFICGDIVNFTTNEKFDIWHDRAVFHFLLLKKEREKYFQVLLDTLKDDGFAIISTFRIDGPIQCAGLNIIQYDRQKMALELPNELELIESLEYAHLTPKKTQQKYIYFVIRKKVCVTL